MLIRYSAHFSHHTIRSVAFVLLDVRARYLVLLRFLSLQPVSVRFLVQAPGSDLELPGDLVWDLFRQ